MRKSNWIIFAILVIASIIFLSLWYYLHFDLIDNPLDLVLSIIWWVLIIVLCYAIHRSEKKRQEARRTLFIAPGTVYNRELGMVKLEADDDMLTVMQNMLTELEYDFDIEDLPEDEPIRFKKIVHTKVFKDDGERWEGEVIDILDADDPISFENKEELSGLI